MKRRQNDNIWPIHFRSTADDRITSPVMYIEAATYQAARKIAMNISGLSRYQNWICA
jgi:hypothetical protein